MLYLTSRTKDLTRGGSDEDKVELPMKMMKTVKSKTRMMNKEIVKGLSILNISLS